MERESQSAHTRLIEALQANLPKANFYRFCQLLEFAQPSAAPLGATLTPKDDPVRFRPHPGMGFPVSELKRVEWDEQHPERPPTIRTTFLGLYGVDSPLPTSYLDDIAQRREGHEALEAFLDIFNHRILTQFYRIWRKYSYPASFEAGGRDNTSQCLLGLIGLGVPGAAKHIATPISRFLALLSTMRMPTRTAEGIVSLVKLLSPETHAEVRAHYPQRVAIRQRVSLGGKRAVNLSQRQVLGKSAIDANSQLELTLYPATPEQAKAWMENGQLHSDLLVLLRVYLGWRCTARLRLRVPRSALPSAMLGSREVLLGRNSVLSIKKSQGAIFNVACDGPVGSGQDVRHKKNMSQSGLPQDITIHLGIYRGLEPNTVKREAIDGGYHF